MSASDGPRAWDLRCEVRERLIAFLQHRRPSVLPRLRAEIDRDAEPGSVPPETPDRKTDRQDS